MKIQQEFYMISLYMERFILDANLFFNMEAGFDMGKKTDDVIANLTTYAEKLKGVVEFIMPPSAIDEFLSFFPACRQAGMINAPPQIKKLLSVIVGRSPDRNKPAFPAGIFYLLIEEIRNRSYRGLTLGEEEIVKAGVLMQGVEKLEKKDFEIKIGTVIKNFRARYRTATRTGFIDSVADLDLIVLAKEVDGFLVSADEGVVRWGRVFGIKEVPPGAFRVRLDSLLGRLG